MINDSLHVVHPRAAGLDVHKMEITATVRLCDGPGEPQSETRSFSTLPAGITGLVAWLLSCDVTAAAMEATGVYWRMPWDYLSQAGIKAQLLHAQHVKQLRGRKTDIEDSRWLARVCQFGLGRPSLVPDKRFRALRALNRHRRSLVHDRSRVRNRVHKLIDAAGIRIGGIITDIFGVNGRIILDGVRAGEGRQMILPRLTRHVRNKLEDLGEMLSFSLEDWERDLLEDLLSAETALMTRIQSVESRMLVLLEPYDTQLRILQTIPGIDTTMAASILAESGVEMGEFGAPEHFASWAGLSPGNNESAGKRRNGRTRKGSKHLRATLVEAAQAAARTNGSRFQGYQKALTARRGYKRAVVATAHKMALTLFVMLRDGTLYRDPGINYKAIVVNRNAARWLRQLKTFNILEDNGDGTVSVNWNRPVT